MSYIVELVAKFPIELCSKLEMKNFDHFCKNYGIRKIRKLGKNGFFKINLKVMRNVSCGK